MHTPANWTVVSTGPARIPRIESEGTPVALMFQESAHHAALIAAAPDLLAALRLMLREYECLRYDQPERWPEAATAARAALSKALGE